MSGWIAHNLNRTRRQCWPQRLLAWFLMLAVLTLPAQAKLEDSQRLYSEQQALVSALLYNFLLFVDWPSNHQPMSDQSWQICALGQDAVVREINALIVRPARGHKIDLQILKPGMPLHGCHILYFAQNNNAQMTTDGRAGVLQVSAQEMQSALAQLRGSHVLTVAASGEFTEFGGMIRLTLNEERLRIGIHLKNLRAGGLQVSSRLLALPQVEQIKEAP